MMYAFIQNNQVVEYPASRSSLQKRNPNVSFPKDLTDEIYASFGYVRIVDTEQPAYDKDKGQLVLDTPEYVDGSWRQRWKFIKDDDALISQRQAEAEQAVLVQQRAQRNSLLQQSDLDVILSLEATNSIPDALKTYRQALRDVPEQAGFPDKITWPTKP